MKKKISLPIAVTVALVAAAIAFSLAYIIATNSMNKKLTDLNEKQSMFSTLSEADSFSREKSFFEVDEEILTEELCRAYAKAYEGRILYLTALEFEGSIYQTDSNFTVLKLADGNVFVVLTQDQFTTSPQVADGPESDFPSEVEIETEASAE